ncbi:MAG: tetratricopeptide repeat protein [Acidobacteria bacterium]|nr:tetratricopeptide repeat protein [Acidobacteriota bacterium]
MKRVNLKGILAISFLLIFFIATSSYSQAWRGQGRVRGEVLSKDGKPIPNAKIIFTSAKLATKFEVKTDKDGKWKVNGVAGGVWDIDIIAPGYEPKRLTTKISEYLRNKPIIVYLKRAKKPVADEETVKKIDEANQLMSEKKYKEAITIFEQILKENPQIYTLEKNIGSAYFELGNYDKALEHYQKYLENDPTATDVLINIVNTYLEKGELDNALAYLEKIKEETITDPVTFYNIGSLFFGKGDTDLAIKYYQKTLLKDPNFADAYFQLGLCYFQKGDMEQAKINFKKVIELAPDSPNASLAKEFLKNIEGNKK